MKSSEKKKHLDAALDEGLKESFPASDPVAISFLKPVEIAPEEVSSAHPKHAYRKHLSRKGNFSDNVDSSNQLVHKGEKHEEVELKLEIESKHAAQLIKRMPLQDYLIGMASEDEITSTYFDTPDFWLKLHGVSLRLRHSNRGWVQTLKTCDLPQAGLYRRGEWEGPVGEPAFDFVALRQMVGAHKGLKKLLHNKLALNAIFATRVTRTIWNLEMPTGDKVELSLDQGSIKSGDVTEAISEIELELKSGEPTRLFDCALQLIDAIPFRAGNLSKSARGYRLCTPYSSMEAITVGDLDQRNCRTVEEGCKIIIADCVAQIEGNGPVMIQGDSHEGLHQMRIGLRRLQSALALCGNFARPPDETENELTWLAGELGRARDWEVFSNSTLAIVQYSAPEDPGIAQLRRTAIDIAAAKREMAISAVRSVRFTRLILTLAQWLACSSWSKAAAKHDKHKLSGPLAPFARDCLLHKEHELRRCHKDLADEKPKSRHKFRIATKNLRYTTEFFGSLYPKKKLQPFLKVLAALQEEFGHSNDKIVAEGFLKILAVDKKNLRPTIEFARGFLMAKNDYVDTKLWRRLTPVMLRE
jgi:inorganic triphosphatase YgiF